MYYAIIRFFIAFIRGAWKITKPMTDKAIDKGSQAAKDKLERSPGWNAFVEKWERNRNWIANVGMLIGLIGVLYGCARIISHSH